jgi:hypothetical protein
MSNLKQLKTNPVIEREAMLSYLDFLRKQVEEGTVQAFVCVSDDGVSIQCEAIGVADILSIVGMLETAKHSYIQESCE